MMSFQTKLPEQLASGIRVLIYAGDQDYICSARCTLNCGAHTLWRTPSYATHEFLGLVSVALFASASLLAPPTHATLSA